MKILFDLKEDSFTKITCKMLDDFISKKDLEILYNGVKVGEIIDRNSFWVSSNFYSNLPLNYLDFLRKFTLIGIDNESK